MGLTPGDNLPALGKSNVGFVKGLDLDDLTQLEVGVADLSDPHVIQNLAAFNLLVGRLDVAHRIEAGIT